MPEDGFVYHVKCAIRSDILAVSGGVLSSESPLPSPPFSASFSGSFAVPFGSVESGFRTRRGIFACCRVLCANGHSR